MAVSPTPKLKPVKPKPALTNPAQVALEAFACWARPNSFPSAFFAATAAPLAVAYSGGADSTALLHAACALWPGQVKAIHVNHGLQAAADQFEINCIAVCSRLKVPLHVVKVSAGHSTGESPEDAARKARYTGLVQAARALGVHQVLLGQHADDQVETILLALSRGAGLPGLSAMPAAFERDGIQFFRPLLHVPSALLRDWLTHERHAFVDDPSNTDERYTRNRIRARLLPELAEAFPHFRQTFARSASHAAQAQELLNEIAAQDLLQVGSPPVIKTLQTLSRSRQANVLRHWLLVCHQARPSSAQLSQLLGQVAACTTRGHQIHLKVANGHVLRAVGHLKWLAPI
jgi:tRNA(Ile)-lysidine synthase